jgi:hypothetical protein
VTGSIRVTAPNVTIRNVRVIDTDPAYPIGVKNQNDWDRGDANLHLDHVEINLTGHTSIPGIAFNGFTLDHSFIHNGGHACSQYADNVVIRNSLCVIGPDEDNDGWPDGGKSSALCRGPDHLDGLATDGGTNALIQHNTIRNPCSQTAAILVSSNTSHVSRNTIDDNLLAGGGFALYCAGLDDRSSVDHIVATNNRFARTWYPGSGYWGATIFCEFADVFSGNVWDDTNKPAS